MKKKKIAIAIIVLILLILFVPIPWRTLKEGGTRDYCALTYRIVVWNRFIEQINEDGSTGEMQIYKKTSIFWFPDNFKSIDELWEIETENNR